MRLPWKGVSRIGRSLYARIALVYLASLVLLSLAASWLAVSQFDHLSSEMQQRMQLGLASNLAQVLQKPLQQGVMSPAVQKAVDEIHAINPGLSVYLLDSSGQVVGNYNKDTCQQLTDVNLARLKTLLQGQAMFPLYVQAPCSQQPSLFSAASVHYGKRQQAGFLLVLLGGGHHMSLFSMLRYSSMTHTLIIAGLLALIVSAIGGLLLFALLTRRFSVLTRAVKRFATGDYRQRIDPGADDEIGQLGRAFNDLAGTIEAQVAALRENDRQRRKLVAGLSHDFRTPLTSLRGYAERLQDSGNLDSEQKGAVNAIQANCKRLTSLTDQLSTLTRVGAFEEALCIERFSLRELASDVVGKFQPQAQARGVRLKVDASQVARVEADIALIDRALANLIDNALRACNKGDSVELSIVVEKRAVTVRVSDSGVGINADELPLVTQRFYRTPSSRERSKGTGLGLAIVAEVCERHGTRLRLESEPGDGTMASFRLPLAV